jgi:toxin ParE1/3/4
VSLAVTFHPAAATEVEDAEAWYAKQRPELGDAFIADFEATIARVVGNPLAMAERYPGVRQAQLRRFPYLLVFRLRGEVLEVVAVAHGHHAPNYWTGR